MCIRDRLYSILYLFIPKKKHYDFIIIHGAGLLDGEKVTPLLKRRIDKAVEAYQMCIRDRSWIDIVVW